MNTSTRTRRAVLLTIAATFFWPLQDLTGGQLMRNGHHAAQVVALRYIAHLILLVVVVLPLYGNSAFNTRRPLLQLVRGFCIFGMAAGFIMALDFASAHWVWTVFWAMPVLAIAGAALVLRERAPWAAWVAAGVGALAAATVMNAEPAGFIGTVFALVMAGSFAGYVVLSRLLREDSLAASLFYTAIGALAPVALVVGRVWTPLTATDVVPALLDGLLSIITLGCFSLAADDGPVWLIAPLIPLVLIWETPLWVLARGTTINALDLVGMALALVAAGIVLTAARYARMRPTGTLLQATDMAEGRR